MENKCIQCLVEVKALREKAERQAAKGDTRAFDGVPKPEMSLPHLKVCGKHVGSVSDSGLRTAQVLLLCDILEALKKKK